MNFEENEEYKRLMLKYDSALQLLSTRLNVLLKEFEFNNKYNPVEHIKSRIKAEESARAKLLRKGYEVNIENLEKHVHDMVGVRIVCSFLSDVYDIVSIIKNSNQFEIKEEKDYIVSPKDTGYMSYHLIVKVPIYLNNSTEYVDAEIQIRTMAMDFWASLDHKIQYKFSDVIPDKVKEEMYNCSLDIRNLDSKMYLLNEIVNNYKENE